MTTSPTRKIEVFYTLGSTRTRRDDPRGIVTPISTHARYVDAYNDSLEWHAKGGFYRVIERHTNPVMP